ncbi:MAG: hypothetical protein FWC70_03435 [Defluviitaleaceae bacterium]|nr:hypothetical protein [Defluviitaleaceae bacterium]
MKKLFAPKTRMALDPVGLYYASTISKANPGNFNISAYLHEKIDPHVLQTAVNDLMRRLPFLSGRLYGGVFQYYHEILEVPPQIVKADTVPLFSEYYKEGSGYVLRVLYGERHFTVEAIHSIVDGRGLAKIVCALLARYFELLGVNVSKRDIADCTDSVVAEEAEDAYLRYANSAKYPVTKVDNFNAYHHEGIKKAPARVISKTFELENIKAAAKSNGATISEYLLACVFTELAAERDAQGLKNPVTSMLPVDCRSYFPSRTFRTFVCNRTITMPETSDFFEMLKQIRAQFADITPDFVQKSINEVHTLRKKSNFVPLALKKKLIDRTGILEESKLTTTFSNLGLVPLPPEIRARVKNLEFVISTPEYMTYSFSCITIGETLTLTVTSCAESNVVPDGIFEKI